MQKDFVPIYVNRGEGKREKWHIDVSNLNLTELLALREGIFYSGPSVWMLDQIIGSRLPKVKTRKRDQKQRWFNGKY